MRRMKWTRAALLAALAFAIAAGALHAQVQPPPRGQDPIHPLPWGDFDYKKSADQNRYLINKPGDPPAPLPNDPNVHKIVITPGPNMEPRMVHPAQIQETIDKLQSKGFCAAVLQRQCPTCKIKQEVEKSCKRPNILIFLVDDMGWGDFGPYGGGVTYGAATPNVDRLANEGLVLTSTYSQPTCSPSRATIHTGQLPIHHGVLYPPMYGDPGGITRRSIPLPYLLKRQGYRTMGVGKWHMGENKPNMPYRIGYDNYYGFLSVSDMYTEWRDQYYTPEVVRDQERTRYMQHNKFSHYLVDVIAPKEGTDDLGEADTDESWRGQPDPNCHALAEITLPWEAKALNEENERRIKNGQPPIPNQGNANFCTAPKDNYRRVSIADLDELWAERSVKFIQEMAGKTQPWFLYHATRGCHFDNYPQDGDRRASYARTIYADCTVKMDDIFGKLMRTLHETGQDETTLVFFTSDNGPEDEIPPHGHTPFRGGKGDTWEGGVRAPGVAYWKGMITPGRRSDGLFDQADLYTTALSLAGFDYEDARDPVLAKKLKERYLYGIDQTSFLLAKDGESNRRSVLHWYLTNFSAVRMDEFKAHTKVSEPLGLSQGYAGGLSGVDLKVSYLWLFNLQEDPKEQNNINIRHLWAQHLFSGEFGRFMCVLTQYPPYLPTQPLTELNYQAQIQMFKDDLVKYWTACKELPSGKSKS